MRNHRGILVALLLALLLAACTPARLTRPKMPSDAERAEVLIYRESSILAGLSSLIFGANQQDYLVLRNGTYAQLFLSPGTYEFFVRSEGADQPARLPMTLGANSRTCLKGYANPSNVAKSLFFWPAYYLGSTFLLEATACPSSETLATYSRVDVQYAE